MSSRRAALRRPLHAISTKLLALGLFALALGCPPRDAADLRGTTSGGSSRSAGSGAPSVVASLPVTAQPARASGKAMDVKPSSPSQILRATHIVVAHIESSVEGPWKSDADGGEERMVSLVLKVEEILKGTLTQKPGDTVKIEAKQMRLGEAWGPMPGIWSNSPVTAGTRVVAFSVSASEDAAVVLNDPDGKQLYSPEEALVDCRVASQAAAGHMDLSGIVALAKPQAPALGHLFADYLWSNYESAAMADVNEFAKITSFMEEPTLGRVARTTLVMRIVTGVRAPDPPALKHISLFAITLFHLLALPQAAALHDNLVGTYLPNVLELANKDARTADQVFEDHPGEKARALAAVKGYSGTESIVPLVSWLTK